MYFFHKKRIHQNDLLKFFKLKNVWGKVAFRSLVFYSHQIGGLQTQPRPKSNSNGSSVPGCNGTARGRGGGGVGAAAAGGLKRLLRCDVEIHGNPWVGLQRFQYSVYYFTKKAYYQKISNVYIYISFSKKLFN